MANEFKVRKGLIVQGSGSIILDIQGSQGELFSVTDSLSGSLFSVNDISGIPIMEVFSDNIIKMGTFNQEAIIVSGSRTGMGVATPQAKLHISGANNGALLIASSSTAPSALFVSGSGNVGIGTTTPTSLLQVAGRVTSTELYVTNGDAIYTTNGSVGIGTSGPTSTNRLQVRGSGATSATTALRVENSAAAARLTILDDGTSAFNTSHLYVSGSSNVGIGTTNPQRRLHIDASGSVNTNIPLLLTSVDSSNRVGILFASSSLSAGKQHNLFSRVNTPTVEWLLGANAGETAQWHLSPRDDTNYAITLRTPFNGGTAQITTGLSQSLFSLGAGGSSNQHLSISSSGNVGIGITTPTARLQIAGTSNDGISLDANHTLFNGVNARLPGRIIVGASSTGYPKIMYNAIPSASVSWSYSGNDTAWAINMGGGNRMGFEYVAPGTAGTSFSGWNTIMALVSGSNSVGIGTLTPTNTLQVVGGITATSITASIISASSGITGSLFGTSSWAVNALTASFLSGAFLQNGNSFGATALLGTNDNQNLQFETSGSVRMTISSSGNIGIGTNLPSAILHISGASADSLLRIGSPTNSDILFVNGNGRVGINTTSSAGFLGNISTFTIFQNSGSGDGLTPSTGLQIVNSGSSTSAQAQLSIVTVGDKFAALNIGTSGSGTQNNYWHLSKRNAANGHAFQLYNNNNGTFSNPLFSFVKSGNSTLGEATQIKIDDANGRVGLQVTPSDFIHLSSDPSGGNYINIDAQQFSNAPPLTAASAKTGYGITTNSYFLAEPDYWMEIKLGGVIVLVPCYLPA